VLAGRLLVGYEVDAFAVGVKVLVLAELPGESDDVEEFVRIVVEEVVITPVELVVAFALAEEMHEQTAPASTFAARAVTKPQALVAHPRALMTIEFDIDGMHCLGVSKSCQLPFANG
jgi:hypothetical protein